MSNRAAGMPTVGSIEIHDVPTPNPRPLGHERGGIMDAAEEDR